MSQENNTTKDKEADAPKPNYFGEKRYYGGKKNYFGGGEKKDVAE